MQEETVIEVSNVYKKFKTYGNKSNYLKDRFLTHDQNHIKERWVLNGLSFTVAKGQAVGIIGKNGCGKSTTLKLLSKIMYPDKGSIVVKGRVSSLLELGAGFHPDLSGRENIYMNASVFGLTKKEIDARLEDIIRFSELKEFIDNPIRTYSSGMYMKLAFSVAINVDADILLIDEILGVGDVSFQKKCFGRLQEIKANGTTIVIVSHSVDQIEQICDQSVWLDGGKLRMIGNPAEVHKLYLEEMEKERLERMEYERSEIQEQMDKEIAKNGASDSTQQKIKELEQQREREQKEQSEALLKRKKEEEHQTAAQKKAEDLRRERAEFMESVRIAKQSELDLDPKERKFRYYEREFKRLSLTVDEKAAEAERLEATIREKVTECDRLNSIIRAKDTENDRLNLVIAQKDIEFEKVLNKLIEGS